MTLTKPILKAIEQFEGNPDLCWRFFQSDSRTAPYGYALYCRTGLRENFTSKERRLWCGGIEQARLIAAELANLIDPVILEELHERIELEAARQPLN